MKFYTSISRYGNQLLFRGYDNGKKIQQKIKYEEDLTINGVLERSCHIIYNWVNNLEDYSLICKESFYEKLKTILYENYFYNIPLNVAINDEEDYDYFELKHLEEINSLFLKCKELFDYYGVDLFQRKTDNLMNLFYFICYIFMDLKSFPAGS
jgi:hypothetical protein